MIFALLRKVIQFDLTRYSRSQTGFVSAAMYGQFMNCPYDFASIATTTIIPGRSR